MLYITKREALAAGLTHEGTLFGVPAWFGEHNGQVCRATPKIPVLHLWCMFCDSLYEVASYFLHGHTVLKSPIHIERPIK
jgi:hypothetical protein